MYQAEWDLFLPRLVIPLAPFLSSNSGIAQLGKAMGGRDQSQ